MLKYNKIKTTNINIKNHNNIQNKSNQIQKTKNNNNNNNTYLSILYNQSNKQNIHNNYNKNNNNMFYLNQKAFQKIRFLDLSHCKIYSFVEYLSYQEKKRSKSKGNNINKNKNDINCNIKSNKGSLEKLKKNQKDKYLQSKLIIPPNLELLNLSHNYLIKIEDQILNLQYLQTLNLSYNQITIISSSQNLYGKMLPSIKNVNLSNNLISTAKQNLSFVIQLIKNRQAFVQIFNNPIMNNHSFCKVIQEINQTSKRESISINNLQQQKSMKKDLKAIKPDMDCVKTQRQNSQRLNLQSKRNSKTHKRNVTFDQLTKKTNSKNFKTKRQSYGRLSEFYKLIQNAENSQKDNQAQKSKDIMQKTGQINISNLSGIDIHQNLNQFSNRQFTQHIENHQQYENQQSQQINAFDLSQKQIVQEIVKKTSDKVNENLKNRFKKLSKLRQYFQIIEKSFKEQSNIQLLSNQTNFFNEKYLKSRINKIQSESLKKQAFQLINNFCIKFRQNNQICLKVNHYSLQIIKKFNQLQKSNKNQFEINLNPQKMILNNQQSNETKQLIKKFEQNQKQILKYMLNQPSIQLDSNNSIQNKQKNDENYIIPFKPFKTWIKSYKKLISMYQIKPQFQQWNNLIDKYQKIKKIIFNDQKSKESIRNTITVQVKKKNNLQQNIKIEQRITSPNKQQATFQLNTLLFTGKKDSISIQPQNQDQKLLISNSKQIISTPQQIKLSVSRNKNENLTPCHNCTILVYQIQKLQKQLAFVKQCVKQKTLKELKQQTLINDLKKKMGYYESLQAKQNNILSQINMMSQKPRGQVYQNILLEQAKAIESMIHFQGSNLFKINQQSQQSLQKRNSINESKYQNKTELKKQISDKQKQNISINKKRKNSKGKQLKEARIYGKSKQILVSQFIIPEEQDSQNNKSNNNKFSNKSDKSLNRISYFKSNQAEYSNNFSKQNNLESQQKQQMYSSSENFVQEQQKNEFLKINDQSIQHIQQRKANLEKNNLKKRDITSDKKNLSKNSCLSTVYKISQESKFPLNIISSSFSEQKSKSFELPTSIQQMKRYKYYKDYHLRNRLVKDIAENIKIKSLQKKSKSKNQFNLKNDKNINSKLNSDLKSLKSKIYSELVKNYKSHQKFINRNKNQKELCDSKRNIKQFKQTKDELLLSASPSCIQK